MTVTLPPPQSPLILTYSHNVIDHLGLKLYQNKPTNVVAELVSNAWDANAKNVWILLSMEGDRYVSVLDDGHGMTHEELAKHFLVIGAPKRSSPGDKSRGNKRKLMGRKGIGKLAPFGIADVIDVMSIATSEEGELGCTWIRLEMPAIKAASTGGGVSTYRPEVICDGPFPTKELLKAQDSDGAVDAALTRLGSRPGTLVLLRSLTLQRTLGVDGLLESLGRRLSATLASGFTVRVNEKVVTADSALPDFDFRIPDSGVLTETVGSDEVRFWVGFVKSASWPQDEAGVGVYAHGKICQDRPFTFGAKGKEILTRYMFAVVEADFLDELPEDVISTDRSSTNWDAEALKPLADWGRKKVGQWAEKYLAWREAEEENANRRRVKQLVDDKKVPSLTVQEQETVSKLLSKITPALGKDDDDKELVAKSISAAWVREPMRELVKQLWSEFGSATKSVPQVFSGLIEKLVAYSIPESLNLALVFAQRAFALTKLYDYVHNGREVDLQKLLEEFPWIMEPDSIFLTANQPLKTTVEEAEKAGLIPQPKKKVVAGTPETNKPDLVFLTSPDINDIVVVELKNPQLDLTIENREQLHSYMVYLEAHYPDAKIRGYLVGRGTIKIVVPTMELVQWTEVLARARARYVTFLAAMLASVPEDTVKLDTVHEFAGPDVWELLKKLATKSQKLTSIIDKYERKQ